jgi:hypothetical protein
MGTAVVTRTTCTLVSLALTWAVAKGNLISSGQPHTAELFYSAYCTIEAEMLYIC